MNTALPQTAYRRRIIFADGKAVTRLYDSVEGVLYAGVAKEGSDENEPVWRITKITLNEDSTLDTVEVALNAVWTNRETETYV